MRTYSAVLLGLLVAGCASRTPPTPPVVAPQPEASKPVASQPAAPQPEAPKPVATQPAAPQPEAPKPVATQPAAPQPEAPKPVASQPAAPQPAKPAAPPPQTARTGAAPVAPAPKPATPPATAPRAAAASPAPTTLDLDALKARLKATKAIGVFTKISLKNKVDDLMMQFTAHYQGKGKPTVPELRQSYDLLMMKVLSLLQDGDPPLAQAIVSSREAIWALLANEKTFATLQS